LDEQIISACVSKKEDRLAIGLGKTAHGADKTITCIIVYYIYCPPDNKNILSLQEKQRQDTTFDLATSIEFQFSNKF